MLGLERYRTQQYAYRSTPAVHLTFQRQDSNLLSSSRGAILLLFLHEEAEQRQKEIHPSAGSEKPQMCNSSLSPSKEKQSQHPAVLPRSLHKDGHFWCQGVSPPAATAQFVPLSTFPSAIEEHRVLQHAKYS